MGIANPLLLFGQPVRIAIRHHGIRHESGDREHHRDERDLVNARSHGAVRTAALPGVELPGAAFDDAAISGAADVACSPSPSGGAGSSVSNCLRVCSTEVVT